MDQDSCALLYDVRVHTIDLVDSLLVIIERMVVISPELLAYKSYELDCHQLLVKDVRVSDELSLCWEIADVTRAVLLLAHHLTDLLCKLCILVSSTTLADVLLLTGLQGHHHLGMGLLLQ